jgi:CheY-specific phosphatase CheX
MLNSLKSRLYQATALTFEQLGFVLPASELDSTQRGARCDARVMVSFHGPCEGRLIIATDGDVLATVVANMLGDEGEISEESRLDALGELANVICGNVLPLLMGPAAIVSLAPPRVISGEVGAAAADESVAAEVEVGLDDGRAEVTLLVRGTVPEAWTREAA